MKHIDKQIKIDMESEITDSLARAILAGFTQVAESKDHADVVDALRYTMQAQRLGKKDVSMMAELIDQAEKTRLRKEDEERVNDLAKMIDELG